VANDARSQPPDKYGFLAEAAEWSTNLGHPGYANAAIDEVVKASLISQMFAADARGEMSAEEAGRAAEAKVKPISTSGGNGERSEGGSDIPRLCATRNDPRRPTACVGRVRYRSNTKS
jgi:hypothetical protein